MKYIELQGSPSGMGRQHGAAFRQEIQELIGRFCSEKTWLWKSCGLSRCDVDRIRVKLLRRTQAYAPDAVEEMQGIAEGAGQSFEDIQLINFLGDIGLVTLGCTNVIFTAGPDGPLLGKNNDLYLGEGNPILLKKICPEKGYAHFTHSWVGTVWAGDGMNEQGLCYGGASGPIRKVRLQLEECVSSYLLFRQVFSLCATVGEAVAIISASKIFGKSGESVALLDALGQAAVIEKCGFECEIRRPSGNWLFCTDSFTSSKLREISIPRGEHAEKNSGNRNCFLQEMLPQLSAFSIQEMKSILRGHCQPGAICQHGTEDGDLSSVASMIMAPKAKQFLMTHGNPCQSKYVARQF